MSYSTDGSSEVCLVLALIVTIPIIVASTKDTNKRKIEREEAAKTVLEQAHKQAVAAVDTINYNDIVIKTKSARKDSAQATKQMYKIMGNIQLNKSNRFFDFVQDSIPITSDYSRTISTYVDSVRHDTTRITIVHHKTVCGATPKFNLNKAMNDSAFAATYRQYCEAIKQLEIARRQQKSK